MWSRLGNVAWDQGRFQEALDDHKRAIIFGVIRLIRGMARLGG